MTLEAAQHVERPRHHLDHITLACEIAGEHSLLAKPFRASSHFLWLHSALRNKIPLAEQTTSGNLPPQQKAVHEDTSPSDGPRGERKCQISRSSLKSPGACARFPSQPAATSATATRSLSSKR